MFFVNVFSGSIISQVSLFSSVKDLPMQLARAVPTQVILASYSLVCQLTYTLDCVFSVSNLYTEHALLSNIELNNVHFHLQFLPSVLLFFI